uniref:Uncharacterized protein n=1 Tax=Caenorhabditis japonica TaxID=281687 RepID=A0A8R1DZ69_CAEJA
MRDDEVPAGPVAQKPAEEQDEAAERKIDAQIDELIRVFDNPNAPFEEKMHALIRIPTEIQHVLMTRDRADRLLSKIPVEMYRHVFDPDVKE